MKKVLLISSTELSTYQMLTYIKQNKKKCNVDYLICNKYKKVFNKNFKSLQKKLFIMIHRRHQYFLIY